MAIAIALALAACSEPAVSSPDPAPTPVPVPAPAPAPVPVPDLSPPPLAIPRPFVFYEPTGHEVPSAFGAGGTGPVQTLSIVGDERRYVAERDGDAIVLERRALDGSVRWSQRISLAATSDPVVASRIDGAGLDQVLLAAPTADGYALEARAAADGALAWHAEIASPGASAVQLVVAPAELAVFTRAGDEDRIDVLDAAGSLLGRAALAHAITRAPLEPPATAHRERVAIAPRSSCEVAVQAEDASHRVRALFCPGATGVEVVALDDATGAERWRTTPHGIGSIGHSRYANDVAIAIDGPYVRVWGHESAGDHVGTLDLETGRELATIVRRR